MGGTWQKRSREAVTPIPEFWSSVLHFLPRGTRSWAYFLFGGVSAGGPAPGELRAHHYRSQRGPAGDSTDLELLGDLGLLPVHGVQDGGDDGAGAQEDELAQRGPPSVLHGCAEPRVRGWGGTARSGPATPARNSPSTSLPPGTAPLAQETFPGNPYRVAKRFRKPHRKWGGGERADRKVVLPG